MLKFIAKLLKALCSNTDPAAVAHSVSLGVILGFVPKDNALWVLLFVFVFFMRIQRGGFLLCMAAGALTAPLLDPLFDSMGIAILGNSSLAPHFARMLEVPFVAFTRFNNSVVMGSLAFGVAAYIPLYAVSMVFIFLFRKYVAGKTRRLVNFLSGIPVFVKIREMAGLGGE